LQEPINLQAAQKTEKSMLQSLKSAAGLQTGKETSLNSAVNLQTGNRMKKSALQS
jgi:hypothetical protein